MAKRGANSKDQNGHPNMVLGCLNNAISINNFLYRFSLINSKEYGTYQKLMKPNSRLYSIEKEIIQYINTCPNAGRWKHHIIEKEDL